jgi:hypothetical protein
MRCECRQGMKIFGRHRRRQCTEGEGEIEAAKMATEESARAADEDIAVQQVKLAEERESIMPLIKRLHDQNHVADALIHVIETSRKK